jgi:hyperosmotically inducible periplasmic protein
MMSSMSDLRAFAVGRWLVAVATSAALITACGQSDPAIQTAVDSQLAVDSVTAPLSVDISVTQGVVRLAGEVQSREQQRRAVALARGIRGVKDVVDEMYLSDATIVTAVKKTLAADPLVGRVPIEVDSSGGNIRLMSEQTNKDERARAVEISSTVDGVKHVEDRLR